jgi:type II secretory pathway component GspD/PulD (secretin)
MRTYPWIRTVAIVVIMSGLLDARPSAGQTTPPASAAALAKVEVTLTRLQGETRLSSVPYVLSVGMDNFMARLRIGVDVPTGAQSTRTTEGVTRSEWEYRNIGTSIDAQLAPPVQEGQYQLFIDSLGAP